MFYIFIFLGYARIKISSVLNISRTLRAECDFLTQSLLCFYQFSLIHYAAEN